MMNNGMLKLKDNHAPRLNPALASEIGLNESLILLQVEFWISISNNIEDGKRWTYQSVRDMKKKTFTFWSIATINRTINNLLKKGYLIEGNYNKIKYDRTRWFTLNFDKLKELNSLEVFNSDTTKYDSSKPTNVTNTITTHNDTHSSQSDTHTEQSVTTIPETSTERTTKTINQSISKEKRESNDELNEIFKQSDLGSLEDKDIALIEQSIKSLYFSKSSKVINKIDVSPNEIREVLKSLEHRHLTQALKDYSVGASASHIKYPVGYLGTCIYNAIFTTDMKTKHSEQTYNQVRTNKVKTKFHNFEQRTDKYDAKELERMVLSKRKRA